MPKVRASSATIGTRCGRSALSRVSVISARTNTMVVEISRSPLDSSSVFQISSPGSRARASPVAPPRRQMTAQRRAPLLQVLHLRAVLGRPVERHPLEVLVLDRDVPAIAELLEDLEAHLLLLVRDVLALAGQAHAVALDRLGQDHGRLAPWFTASQ